MVLEYIMDSFNSTIGPLPIRGANQNESFISPAQYGLTCSIILSLLYHFGVYEKLKDDLNPAGELYSLIQMIHWKNCDYLKLFKTTVSLLIFLCMLPIIIVTLTICYFRRMKVHNNIKKKYGNKFKEFLTGNDAVWALEESVAKSMINVMVLLEINDTVTSANLSAEILIALRKRLSSRLLGDYKPFPKMFYKRNVECGFTFWTDEERFCIEDYVRYMPELTLSDKCEFTNKETIQNEFGHLCNVPLPFNHTASWEVLVSKKPIYCDNTIQVPVLFRVHHSLGDGVALLRLFLETIADKDLPKKDYWAFLAKTRPSINTHVLKGDMASFQYVSASQNWQYYLHNKNDLLIKIKKHLFEWIKVLYMLLTTPVSLYDQTANQSIDKNFLHNGAKLSGKKLISWRCEKDGDGNLIETMKSIKQHVANARFSDVFLAALSITFEKYFQKKGETIPDHLTTIIPARVASEGPTLVIQNKFSMALQTLPIKSKGFATQSSSKFYQKIVDVKHYSDVLRKSSDYFINYWMMSILPALLPQSALDSFLNSPHSTLAISNLPGPQNLSKINGFLINNIVFWLPNRGSTGMGISILSYANRLQLGIIIDRAIIGNTEDAEYILENTILEIQSMAMMAKQNIKRNSIGEIIRPTNFYVE